jgi:hypothetical protein
MCAELEYVDIFTLRSGDFVPELFDELQKRGLG